MGKDEMKPSNWNVGMLRGQVGLGLEHPGILGGVLDHGWGGNGMGFKVLSNPKHFRILEPFGYGARLGELGMFPWRRKNSRESSELERKKVLKRTDKPGISFPTQDIPGFHDQRAVP
ncbi:hypothetical protein TURU_010262 [Turdus rufiventris]|nr:hypothetical protein TURU_010262 [Turdus rufiventris]